MILPTSDSELNSVTPAAEAADSEGATAKSSGLSPAARRDLADLVARARAGEAAAQTLLVQRYTRRISGYVRSIIHQPEAVEDVVQTVFIKMFRRLGRLRDGGSFESWLFRLARNTSVDFIRRRRCRPITVPSDDSAFDIPDPSDATATREILDALAAALSQVSAKDRRLVNLFVAGNSYQTLARDNGLTLGAVKARLHRMRPFLRAFVGEATATRLPEAGSWDTPRPTRAAA
jgi:RNA polymerase sigma-70 factor (ECF subfamily)